MPICPKCDSSFHKGASELCPMCGYSLSLADQVYGNGIFDLSRVTDPAGALKQEEIYKLSDFLEQLERRVAPVALAVYITDQGQTNAFTQHAHWILNHGQINHASFGKRSARKAIEESTSRIIKVDLGGQEEQSEFPAYYEAPPDIFTRLLRSIKDYFQKPIGHVEPEWLLMLVIDVQLRAACFTWGYKLDPYIESKWLEEAIKDKRLKFRESALVPSIKAVLRRTVASLASSAIDTNAKLKLADQPKNLPLRLPEPSPKKPRDFSTLIRNAEMRGRAVRTESAISGPREAKSRNSASNKKNTTREGRRPFLLPFLLLGLLADSPHTSPSTAPKPPLIGSPATSEFAPSWAPSDATQLANAGQAELYRQSLPRNANRPTPALKEVAPCEPIKPHELIDQARHSFGLLLDPRGLLSKQEHQELSDRLRLLQAETPYTIYLCILQAEQPMTSELEPETLLGFIGKSGEFCLMLQYRVGKAQSLHLGYHAQIELSDATITHINEQLQHSVINQSGHTATLLAALDILQYELEEPSRFWDSDMLYGAERVKKLDIEWEDDPVAAARAKFSFKEFVMGTSLGPEVWVSLSFILCTSLYLLGRVWRRRRVQLYDTEADYRLSSPVGASVSRPVRYREGRVIEKSSSPAMGPHRN